MFEENNNKRKFQCFCCGLELQTPQEFQTHITETHEEGRDYIKCPLARCQKVIRDTKIHFKLCHPQEPLPKHGAMRSLIWKDFGGKNKGKTRKPKFREGYLVSNKMNGKEVHYRSGMECKIYEILENDPAVITYDAEPFSIQYLFEGKSHKYYPDISILLADGSIEIWEIKPSSQTSWKQNQAKWEAAKLYCEARGWQFTVITEKGLSKLKRKLKFTE